MVWLELLDGGDRVEHPNPTGGAERMEVAQAQQAIYFQSFRALNTFMAVRILIVDDHPVVRHGLKLLLGEHPGWEIIGEAADGVEAVDKADTLDPDVVVLDVTMPRMNGLE